MPKTWPRVRYGLRASPFFRLRSRKRLAELLHVTPSNLAAIADDSNLYARRWKHKSIRDGETGSWRKIEPKADHAKEYRPIDIPNPRLKAIQSRISELLARIATPEFLFSPVKGRSYVDNAAHHCGSKAFWLLDVADYFPSCTANNVARFFRKDLECSPDVAAVLVRLTTFRGSLPQGSPCSPILAYFSNRPMWGEIDTLVQATGCKLSLYADDITISGPMIPKAMIWRLKQVVHKHGHRLKPAKEVSLISAPADVTGVIVRGEQTLLPNRQLKLLAELKKARRATKSPKARQKLDNQIAGRKAQRNQVERR